MSRRPPEEPAAEPAPVDMTAIVINAARVLGRIGTPEAIAAINDLEAAARQLTVAFDRASEVLIANIPAPETAH